MNRIVKKLLLGSILTVSLLSSPVNAEIDAITSDIFSDANFTLAVDNEVSGSSANNMLSEPIQPFAVTQINIGTASYTITAPGEYEVTGITNTNQLKVADNVRNVKITLNNVNISYTSGAANKSTFSIGVNSEVTLLLPDGTNNIFNVGQPSATCGAIQLESSSEVNIDAPIGDSGTGKLEAYANWTGAAIGSANGKENGKITINNGFIWAVSSQAGAGIGGGKDANGGKIVINGGTVIAQSLYGSGIGGGYNNVTLKTADITIDASAKVFAYVNQETFGNPAIAASNSTNSGTAYIVNARI